LTAGAFSFAADLVNIKNLSNVDYRPRFFAYAVEALDAAVWGIGAGPLPNAIDAVIVADSLPSAIESGFRIAAGNTAVPVYDERYPFPPHSARQALPSLGHFVATMTVPFASAFLARRAVGYRTNASSLAFGIIGGTIGVIAGRYRHRLQAQTKEAWLDRAHRQVEVERASAQFHLAASTSPGHDFKKTLFTLGVFGSDEAMQAALEQGARPGALLADLVDRPLGEVAYRIPIDPPEQSMRPINGEQAQAVEEFLRTAIETASHGGKQVIRVDDLEGTGIMLSYLGRELVLHDQPPPFVARLNPTAIAMCAALLIKTTEALLPYGQSQSLLVVGPQLALDVNNLIYAWRHPPTEESLDTVVNSALVSGLVGIAAAGTRATSTTNRDGANAYPAFHALRDPLFVMLPNWDMLRPYQKRLVFWAAGTALVATVFRRRRVGIDWLDLVAELSIVVNALSVWRLSRKAGEEGKLIEDAMFTWYAGEVNSARRAAQETELASYQRYLLIARRALDQLGDLEPDDRAALEMDCADLEMWLSKARATLSVNQARELD
jgi:hypothetical protein